MNSNIGHTSNPSKILWVELKKICIEFNLNPFKS